MTTSTASAAPAAKAPHARGHRNIRWSTIGTALTTAVILVWCLAPFYWMLVLAFRDNDHTFSTDLWFSHVTLDNFRYAFDDRYNAFTRSLVNSLLIGTVVTAVSMVIGVFAAYALARLTFRGKGLVLTVILGASMFPGVAILTPLFQLFSDWHWLGTYQALALPQISFSLPLAVYTLTSFFADMPWNLEEAARVDGATSRQAFRLVILPLAAPPCSPRRSWSSSPRGTSTCCPACCPTAPRTWRRPPWPSPVSPRGRTSSPTPRRWPPVSSSPCP